MKLIEKRDSITLQSAIIANVNDHSVINTDMWRAYGSALVDNPLFEHQTVNYSLDFVNSLNGTHTQNIDAVWSTLND